MIERRAEKKENSSGVVCSAARQRTYGFGQRSSFSIYDSWRRGLLPPFRRSPGKTPPLIARRTALLFQFGDEERNPFK
jgi:hypothetical protein